MGYILYLCDGRLGFKDGGIDRARLLAGDDVPKFAVLGLCKGLQGLGPLVPAELAFQGRDTF